MYRAILIAAVLTMALAMSAYAALPTFTWSTQLSDTFANATAGATIGGVAATGGGGWACDGDFVGYDDGGNMVLQAKNRTAGTGYKYAWVFGTGDSELEAGAADVNRQSFKAKYLGGTNTRADRGVLTNWNGGAELGNGSDAGGGFAFYGSNAPAVAGCMGSADFGVTGSPAGSYATSHLAMIGAGLTAGWHEYDQIIYRNTVGSVLAGTCEWYIDGALVWSNTPAETGQWVLGGDVATPSRHMADFEFWQPGRDVSGTYSMLIDDISIQYANAVPEPSSLIAFATFGIGAFGLMRRRRA